ncbi:MAG: helix-turn-helix domain-containing protein [Bacteroidota bacterium]
MKHIAILALEDAVLATIDGPRMMFEGVNDFLAEAGRPPFFKVEIVGINKEVRLHGSSFSVHCDKLITEPLETDMIIIPALKGDSKGDITNAIAKNNAFVPWIKEQHEAGTEVSSLCLGAFILAATGMLNGRKCSTHWMYAGMFRAMFPSVELVDDKIITEEQGLYSSGGANSYWNLLLYLVEKFTTRDLAILASKVFALDIDRNSQSMFLMFNGQKGHQDEEVKKAQEFIENNVTEKISVEDLAVRFAVGRRSFEKRFKKATNNTPVEYIQRAKIEVAKRSLEGGRKNVNEVMYEVGYFDTKAFRSVFKKITGLTPLDYRNKYSGGVTAVA